MDKIIPIVMDAGALSDAARQHTHAGEPANGVPGQAPAWVFVEDTAITEAEIAREMQFHRADDPHASRQQAARTLVIRELLRRECERLGLDEVIAEGAETTEEAAIRILLERESPTPEPDPAASRRWFEANRERMRSPDRVHARHILLAAAPADTDARLRARELGDALIAQLQDNPARFAEFAARHSACPSASEGGDLDWIEHGQTTPEFERQLFMLKPGLAGLTIESRWGHHVVFVDAIERGQPLEFTDCEQRIASYLQAQSCQHAIHQYLRQLHHQYRVRGLDE